MGGGEVSAQKRSMSWAGRSFGPQPDGSLGQLAYSRPLVLEGFESSLKSLPPSAPISPLASVPWQHLGGGVQKEKGPLSAQLPLLRVLPDSMVHTWDPTGPLPPGSMTNPGALHFPSSAPETRCQILLALEEGG